MQTPLFETRTEAERMQERAELVDHQIVDVLCGRAAFPLVEDQRTILQLLRFRRGRSKALRVGEICDRVKTTPRTVKDLVRSLVVDFRLPIGSSRDGVEGGYYLIMTDEEALDTARPYINEALKLIERAKIVAGERALLELRNQLSLNEEIR